MSTQDKPLLQFPCLFSIKVFGIATPEFEIAVQAILHTHIPQTDIIAVDTRPSKANKYVALTLRITATSQAQLDALYQELSAHKLVLMAL